MKRPEQLYQPVYLCPIRGQESQQRLLMEKIQSHCQVIWICPHLLEVLTVNRRMLTGVLTVTGGKVPHSLLHTVREVIQVAAKVTVQHIIVHSPRRMWFMSNMVL